MWYQNGSCVPAGSTMGFENAYAIRRLCSFSRLVSPTYSKDCRETSFSTLGIEYIVWLRCSELWLMLWFAPTMSVDTEATACAARSVCALKYARAPLLAHTPRKRTVRFGLGSTPAWMSAIHARPASSCVA